MALPVRAARVCDEPLSVDRLLGLVLGPLVGGVALFVGVVRDHDKGAAVVSLDYTQHPTAEQVLRRCAERVAPACPGAVSMCETHVGVERR